MCGIGGILRTDGKPIPDEWLDAIDARIAYRGPDGHGRFRDRVEIDTPDGKRTVEVAFVHRRLSIIDHEDGAQPMVSERGRNESEGLVAVVFNGCIYNHRELRNELESEGHHFVTDHSDTEVLIHGWRQWKEKLPEHLEGMYAFAVWDRIGAIMLLARDPFGEKPLCACIAPDDWLENYSQIKTVAFSSEFAALCAIGVRGSHHGWTEHESSSVANSVVFGYVNDGIPPAESLKIEYRKGATPVIAHEWRDLSGIARRRRMRSREPRQPVALADIEQGLDKAVARRLEADVPLGCFLSGGVDSSLVAHFAKQQKPDLMTFSVRMLDARYDESAHAKRVAKHLGTNHTTLAVSMNPAEDLVHLIDILGQPFGDSSILPTYWVSKAARAHVKVALSGDGGDELFLGYERYMAARSLARHWWWLRLLPAPFMHRAHLKSRWNKLARLIDMARDYPHIRLAAMETIFTQSQTRTLGFDETEISSSIPSDMVSDVASQQRAIDELRHFDLDNYLPNDLLRKVDTASMACALEVRCPFLDRDLARAALAMPIEELIPGGKRKGLLRQIARKYLPDGIVDRPKMGFAVPIGEWFRSDYGGMKTLLLDHLQSTNPFGPIELNKKAVQRFIDEHMSSKSDHSHRLFTLLTLSIWAKSL